jgi:putative two-component system response regulator
MVAEVEDQEIHAARILIVDDEQANVRLLETVLARAAFSNTISTTDSRKVLGLFRSERPDLVLLDLRMPGFDGFAVLQQLQKEIPPDEYLPILVLTADVGDETKRRALSVGAKDFLLKPFDQVEVVLRVKNLLEARILHVALQNQNEILEERVRERTAGLWEAVQRLGESEAATRAATDETIQRLAMAAELRDEETGWHIARMSRYAAILGGRTGMDEEACEVLRLASSMHDVGKIGVADRILLKRGRLTPKEFEGIKEHPNIGYRILADSKADVLQLAAAIALTHHERFDGSGYPHGLAGNEIPIVGRIAAIADVFDALTSDRVYRKAFPLGQALDMLKEERGRHFDPELLNLFLDSLDGPLEIMHRFRDSSSPALRRAH